MLVPQVFNKLALNDALANEGCLRLSVDRIMVDLLQVFYTDRTLRRAAMQTGEPPRPIGMVASVADCLSRDWTPETPQHRIGDRPGRFDRSWAPKLENRLGLYGYLTHLGLSRLESRDVMVNDEPLRRADLPRR